MQNVFWKFSYSSFDISLPKKHRAEFYFDGPPKGGGATTRMWDPVPVFSRVDCLILLFIFQCGVLLGGILSLYEFKKISKFGEFSRIFWKVGILEGFKSGKPFSTFTCSYFLTLSGCKKIGTTICLLLHAYFCVHGIISDFNTRGKTEKFEKLNI